MQPPANDPNAALHRQQLKSLALAAQAIQPEDKTPARNRDRDIVDSRHASHHRSGRSHHSDEEGEARAGTGPAEADLEDPIAAIHTLIANQSHVEHCASLDASVRRGCPNGSS